MNKQQKIRSLTWKYFWKQKVEEIKECVFGILLISLFLVFLLIFLGYGLDSKGIEYGMAVVWIGYFILMSWILFGIIIMIRNFIRWLSNNWKKAKGRAEKEIKNE